MARNPKDILAEMRQKDPKRAAALDTKTDGHIAQLDSVFEKYISMCMQGASVLSVISFDEAKHPREKEDARKSAIVAHSLVGAVHDIVSRMPPPMRAAVIQDFTTTMSQFMGNNEAKLTEEIDRSRKQRHEMLERLRAEPPDAPVEGVPQ